MASDLESEVDNLQLIYGYPIDGPYDFELWYDSAKKKYSFSIETLIEFNDANAGSKNFVRNILKEFALWMLENNHDLTYRLSYWDVFNHGITIDGEYDTIEQAYAAFRVLALGFSHGTGTNEAGSQACHFFRYSAQRHPDPGQLYRRSQPLCRASGRLRLHLLRGG